MSSTALASTLAPYSKEIAALTVSVLGTIFARLIQPKAKLIHSERHHFHYILQEPIRDATGKVVKPTQTVIVRSYSVSNTGKSTATNVELVFNWKPSHFNVWPLRHYTTRDHPDGRFSLVLENLAPKEVFGMELLSVNVDLPVLCNVRSEQTESVERPMILQIIYPGWARAVVGWLMFAGLVTSIYLLLALLQWAVS